jgi:hypothetical protein
MTSLGSPTNGGSPKHLVANRRDGIRPLVPLLGDMSRTFEAQTGSSTDTTDSFGGASGGAGGGGGGRAGDAGQGGEWDNAGAFPLHPKRASHMFAKHLHPHPDVGLDSGRAHGEPQRRCVEPALTARPVQDLDRREYRVFRSVYGTKIFLRWLLHPVSLSGPVQAGSQLFADRPNAVHFASFCQLAGLTGARRIL